MRFALGAPLLAAVAVLAGAMKVAGGSALGYYIAPNGAAAIAAAQAAAAAAAASATAAATKQTQALAGAAKALQNAQQNQIGARGIYLLNMPNPRNSGQPLPNVVDGLGLGGLSYDAAAIAKDPTLWQGANLPQQFSDSGKVTVNIQQTATNAILNWQTFNVGAKTTLNFLQGGSDWSVLNRAAPGGLNPSQILGQINAPGSVYVINQNGIVFGGGSQINVHSMIASSLDVGAFGMTRAQRDAYFLNSGIAVPALDSTGRAQSFSSTIDTTSTLPDGDVTVMPGARITSAPAGALNDEPGFVYLFGANVANQGTITAPLGEVALVAGQGIAIMKSIYDPSVSNQGGSLSFSDRAVSIRGTGFSITNRSLFSIVYPQATGLVTNSGIISTPGGSTILNGDVIDMSGVISADSGLVRNSQVFLDAQTRINLSGTISILPLENDDTPLPSSDSTGSNSVSAFALPSIGISAYQVNLAPSALIAAPGASVAVSATSQNFMTGVNYSLIGGPSASEQIVMQSGAKIDVSGLQNVQLPANYDIVAVQLNGNELADDPLQKSGLLAGQTVYIDFRNTGTRSDGTTWIGSPLLSDDSAKGYLALIGRNIDQLLTAGGSVSFKTQLDNNAGLGLLPGLVSLQPGSSINVAGGSVSYQSGYVPITRLIGSDGKIYDISQADPNLTYVGIYGHFTVSHPHWNVNQTFVGAFGSVYQAGYSEGHDAGGIAIQAVTPQLNADLQFGAMVGARQAALGQSGTAVVNGVSAQANPNQLPSQGHLSLTTPQSILISDGSADYSNAQFQPQNTSPLQLSASLYSSYGLSSLSLTANDLYIPAGTPISLASGGSFSARTAGAIDVEGSIVARGGQINLTTGAFDIVGNLTLGKRFLGSITNSQQSDIFVGGTLDVRGLWVNDFGLSGNLLAGPGFINGGSIAIRTDNSDLKSGGSTQDASGNIITQGATGNIILAAGSVLDASSGGYINQNGVAKTLSSGVMAGSGGNITLATFQIPLTAESGGFLYPGDSGNFPDAPSAEHDAVVKLGGVLSSYGFASGGTLTIETPSFQIGGKLSTDPNVLNLPASFFTQGGFGAYVLTSPKYAPTRVFARTIELSANENLVLQQGNYSSLDNYRSVITGSDIAKFAPLVTLATDQRRAVNLTLQSLNVLLGTGSAVNTDPGANLNVVVDDATGSAQLLGSIVDHGGSLTVQSPQIMLGAGATIDLSGIFIANSTFGQVSGASQSGTLLNGGTVTFDTSIAGFDGNGSLGYVVAGQGASIDVSGAAADIIGRIGTKNVPLNLVAATTVPSWTDGGTVSINTGTFLWGGSFKADAGAPQGNRGTLVLGGNTVTLQQTVSSSLDPSKTSGVFAVADQLAAFDTVYLYAGVHDRDSTGDVLNGGLGFFSAATPYPAGVVHVPLAPLRANLLINGDVNLSIKNRLNIEAAAIVDQTQAGADVKLSANYVELAGSPDSLKSFVPSSGSRSLVISANTIDVQSAGFNNFKNVTLTSAGDIRLMSAPVNNGEAATNATTFFGQIVAGGSLSFEAQRIYPVTAVDFEIVSTNADPAQGVVTFSSQSGADASAPLSAGGSLTVSAATIIQNGNLFAPLGRISLGAQSLADLSPNDTRGSLVPTVAVTLGAGSLTSTSLGDLTVPYGQTEDGTNWFYNSAQAPLTGAPAKSIRLTGSNVTTTADATVDLHGGGDLRAFEFVQGKGGSRDVLSDLVSTGAQTRPTYAQPIVYAIFPTGKQPSVGAFDIHFNSFLGDKEPLAGQQIYLDGTTGVAAGWYTLYSSHYATLPGAYRVVDYGSSLAHPGLGGIQLPDGTQIVGGYFGQSVLGLRSSGTELFSVQSSGVWRQYSEIDPSSANAYFSPSAGHVTGTAVLPVDGGRLAINAATSLVLDATFKSQAAAGGRGGDLDLTASNIDIVEHGATAAAGYLGVDVNLLNNSGFASLLIGGIRTDESDGTLITPVAENVRVDLGTTALSAPEIILVAAPVSAPLTIPVNGPLAGFSVTVSEATGGTVTVAKGSVITATGDTGNTGRRYYLAGGSTPYTASSLAAALGGTLDPSAGTTTINGATFGAGLVPVVNAYDAAGASTAGALLLVSNAANVTVTRRGPLQPSLGPVTVNFGGFATGFSLVLPDPAPGAVTIESGAQVGSLPNAANATKSVVLSATAAADGIKTDPTAIIGARSLTLAASSMAIGDADNLAAGLVISHDLLSQLTAVNSLQLQALSGGITFGSFASLANCAADCPVNLGGSTLQNLTLDTSSLIGSGANVNISALGTLTLLNSGTGASPTATVQSNSLTLFAKEIDLGGGNVGIAGFNAVTLVGTQQVFVKGAGAMTIGAVATDPTPVDMTIATPNFVVGSGSASQFTLTTLGRLLLQGSGSAPVATTELGGNLAINAGSIELQQATIQAVSGTVALHATAAGGFILLGDNSLISAPGYAQQMFDATRYSPGGKVTLTSDHGDILTSASSGIDLSQPKDGLGGGGELDITALEGNIVGRGGLGMLDAAISATGAAGRGGIFHLDIKGGLANNSLDSLAAKLLAGGFVEEVDIHTRTGGIGLNAGQTLRAHNIVLTADETDPNLGRVRIADGATLDASGAGSTAASTAGGSIELYGRSVDLSGTLIASAVKDSLQAGGTVTVGTTGTPSGATDTTYGYEILSSAGLLNVDDNFRLDLSGGAKDLAGGIHDGSLDGSITFRAPLLSGGTINSRIAILDPQHQLTGVKNITLEAYGIWSTSDNSTGAQHFDGIIDPAGTATVAQAGTDHEGFYQTTLVGFVQNALTPLAANLGTVVNPTTLPDGTTFHIRPGVELQNPDTTVNNGDITVASAWNLAAGTMSNLQSKDIIQTINVCNFGICGPKTVTTTINYFDPASSLIQFAYRFGVEPGALTLRAARNVDVNASISDGFFDTQNFSDSNYSAATTPPWMAVPPAPVPSAPSANSISPVANTTAAMTTGGLASYDLFPDSLNVKLPDGTITTVHPDSWSYRLTAGADFAGTNPNAVGALSKYVGVANGGDVVVGGHTGYLPTAAQPAGSVALPTMLRTGTGDILISAARDLILADHLAPGVIYSAGRNSPLLASPGFVNTGTPAAPVLAIANPDGFVEPNLIAYTLDINNRVLGAFAELGKTTGPVTAAAFPEEGGNILIKAQRDIVGWQNVTSVGGTTPMYQFYAPWMFARSSGSSGAGAFAPIPAAGNVQFQFQPQSAWWIEFGRFDQGVLSAGGDVTVVAGRDMRDFSVSLPTTGRVSGGLTALNTPVTHLYGSGNMNVRVGRDLYSGSFYEGSGSAAITVGGSIGSDWSGGFNGSSAPVQVATVLAADTGQIDVTAAGSVRITDIINPAEIHTFGYINKNADVVGTAQTPVAMTTYGPNSAVQLTSIGGDVVIDAVPGLLSNETTSPRVVQTYPATVDVTALRGNITTPLAGMILTDSPTATLNLVAQGSIDMRGGVSQANLPSSIANTGSMIAAGAALIDLAFNPYEPNMGTLSFTTPGLAHADDPSSDLYDHIYAVTGDITGTIAGNAGYGVIAIPRPVLVKAGRDIIDLNMTAENIRSSDVSQVIAGRDIIYDGLSVGGGLQIAGPGFLDVEAGRNLGPFLPASADLSTGTRAVTAQQGIVSSGDAAGFSSRITPFSTGFTLEPTSPTGALVSYPVGNNFNPIGVRNPLFLGPNATGQRNFLLPSTGASIVALYGVAPGINYAGVVARYVDPATAIPGRAYLDDLLKFINAHGGNAGSSSDVWAQWNAMPVPLQHMFIDQVFYGELKFDNAAANIQDGYALVNTMFPSSLGYTLNNSVVGSSLGSPKDQLVNTGDLNLLHATIQTERGGNVMLFGPGGNILVGSLGVEPNSNLKLNNLGVLTLGGGNLYTFNDQSVLVRASRIFTEQGGDIFMWSSNGNLDGGRGAKTTASLNALAVNIDNNDYQTIDRGGLVTGAGIGTLATSAGVQKATLTLLAPTGTIDAGDAGLRSSGDIILFAAQILNASNISVGGTITSNQTVAVPSLGSLTSASNTTGAAARTDPTSTGSTSNSQPSVVIVEVLGYGGGDGGEPASSADEKKKQQDTP